MNFFNTSSLRLINNDAVIKAVYLRRVSEELAKGGFYPQNLKEKLQKDGII